MHIFSSTHESNSSHPKRKKQTVQSWNDQRPTIFSNSHQSDKDAPSFQRNHSPSSPDPIFKKIESGCTCDGECPKCLPGQTEPRSKNNITTQDTTMCGQEHKQPGRLEATLGPSGIVAKVRSLRGGGQPLQASSNRFFESRFGADFSGVRVHTGTEAAKSAKDLKANAYTFGKDIVFAENKYSPSTEDGKQLLAHELTHVVQQNHDCVIAGQTPPPVISNTPFIARQVTREEEESTGPFPPTVFTPGVAHHHQPTGCWSEVEEDSSCWNSTVECACSMAGSPRGVLMLAYLHELDDLSREHLSHYVQGSGADFIEDLENVVRTDEKFRLRIATAISQQGDRGWVKIYQSNYSDQDFRNSFGAIDRLDFEVNRTEGLVHLWFKDCYEYHPVGYGYELLPGDERRVTNCVHAAAVELKSEGAADFWMIGDTVVPLDLFDLSEDNQGGCGGDIL